ncbi:hypothetical protein PPACK8108_LOCUS4103 [Phakopsora pachyrhizi]|uniref:Uncharacterized protein n=1 Tax=Phakopsora pachyrhizi TaxID=170000 RepID=A0AAV0AL92_PHAPC|nr:hypothetical protein PPACK8108_LOCUS4103 [Phakopsora pachyrhizi]
MMPDIDEVFKSIETFEMKMECLTSSKLGKVLKQVGALDNSKDEFASRVVTTEPVTDVKSSTKTLANGGQVNKENTQPAQVSAENSTKTETSLPKVEAQDEAAPPEMEPQETKDGEMPTERDEKKDDDTEAKDQEKGDLKAAEGKSDKDEIKEDGKKMDCSDSPQPETTKAGESGDANGMD